MMGSRASGMSRERDVAAQREVDSPLSSFPKFCHKKVMKYSFAQLGNTSNLHLLVDDESNMKVDGNPMIGQS